MSKKLIALHKNRIQLLSVITVIAVISGIALTLPLWDISRAYPLAPVIPNFTLGTTFHQALLFILLTGLPLGVLMPRIRGIAFSISLLALFLLILLDITRLQPWILHYAGMIVVLSFATKRSTGNEQRVLDAMRVVIGGIYFWSGLQKINTVFFTEILWFTEPVRKLFPETLELTLGAILLFVPLIEMLFALGLFTKKFRTISIILSFAMLLTVLLSIGPLGHDWNSSVWPWNIAIFLMVLMLFYQTDFSIKDFLFRLKHNYLALVMIGIFWLLPAGNFLGLTDHYLSWSLYSGHVPYATISGPTETLITFSEVAESNELSFLLWAQEELNAVPYPETRVFEQIFSSLCFKNNELLMTIYTPQLFLSNNISEATFTCAK